MPDLLRAVHLTHVASSSVYQTQREDALLPPSHPNEFTHWVDDLRFLFHSGEQALQPYLNPLFNAAHPFINHSIENQRLRSSANEFLDTLQQEVFKADFVMETGLALLTCTFGGGAAGIMNVQNKLLRGIVIHLASSTLKELLDSAYAGENRVTLLELNHDVRGSLNMASAEYGGFWVHSLVALLGTRVPFLQNRSQHAVMRLLGGGLQYFFARGVGTFNMLLGSYVEMRASQKLDQMLQPYMADLACISRRFGFAETAQNLRAGYYFRERSDNVEEIRSVRNITKTFFSDVGMHLGGHVLGPALSAMQAGSITETFKALYENEEGCLTLASRPAEILYEHQGQDRRLKIYFETPRPKGRIHSHAKDRILRELEATLNDRRAELRNPVLQFLLNDSHLLAQFREYHPEALRLCANHQGEIESISIHQPKNEKEKSWIICSRQMSLNQSNTRILQTDIVNAKPARRFSRNEIPAAELYREGEALEPKKRKEIRKTPKFKERQINYYPQPRFAGSLNRKGNKKFIERRREVQRLSIERNEALTLEFLPAKKINIPRQGISQGELLANFKKFIEPFAQKIHWDAVYEFIEAKEIKNTRDLLRLSDVGLIEESCALRLEEILSSLRKWEVEPHAADLKNSTINLLEVILREYHLALNQLSCR